MQQFNHALVVGKFYPPHLGHCLLIHNAAVIAKMVTVVVMASHSEVTLDLESRVQWLQQEFSATSYVRIVGIWDDVVIDYHNEEIWLEHIALMRDGIDLANQQQSSKLALPIDVVVSSEHYGDKMATYFDAVSVKVDVARNLMPVSGTLMRSQPYAHWHLLPQATQAGLCQRIVIVGAESAGKTTLAKMLTERLKQRGRAYGGTPYVAEYGREYNALKLNVLQGIAQKNNLSTKTVFDCQWHSEEFVDIAIEQTRREEIAAGRGSPIIICDTDAFATTIWHKRYMLCENQHLNYFVDQLPKRALYLLADIEGVSFEQDGLRDGEDIREQMQQAFIDALSKQNAPWFILKGTLEERMLQALSQIDRLPLPV